MTKVQASIKAMPNKELIALINNYHKNRDYDEYFEMLAAEKGERINAGKMRLKTNPRKKRAIPKRKNPEIHIDINSHNKKPVLKKKTNPIAKTTERKVQAGINLFKKFRGEEPEFIDQIPMPKMSNVCFVIGDCDGVLYSTIRDGVHEEYIHKFDKRDRPLLVSSHDGKNIYLVGGDYDFTEDGIVDAHDKKHSPRYK